MIYVRTVSEREVTWMLRELYETREKEEGEAPDRISPAALHPDANNLSRRSGSVQVPPRRGSAISHQRFFT